jgi:glucose-1-phosphate adenylyltransferase
MTDVYELSDDTLAVVLAGGHGARLGALTRHVCKPALPFAATCRNIDFSLSNCVNSGIRRIGVATQYKPEMLVRHLALVWNDVARRRGEFLAAWPAQTRAPAAGYRGTADAVFRNLDLIEDQARGLVLVLAGDHVYQMDYRPMLDFHRAQRAAVTIGCIEVPATEADQFGVLSTDARGRVERFVEKPRVRDGARAGDRVLASMGIYVFESDFLAGVLRDDAAAADSRHDFGGDIIPGLVGREAVHAFRFTGGADGRDAYWRDVGTPGAYWRAHLDLLEARPALRLDDPDWPLRSIAQRSGHAAASLTSRPGDPERSLIAAACVVSGAVQRSVLFPGASVGAGSLVEQSLVLPDAAIGKNCRLSGTIVDSDCEVPDGTIIDASWRRSPEGVLREPIVLTADDFACDRAHVSA